MLKKSFIKEFLITLDSVLEYSKVSGDKNPIHLDKEYASKTLFGRRIVHGALLVGYISSVIANDYPGKGSILLNQEIKYLKPTFLNDKVKVRVKLLKEDKVKSLIYLSTNCYRASKEKVIEGTALVKLLR